MVNLTITHIKWKVASYIIIIIYFGISNSFKKDDIIQFYICGIHQKFSEHCTYIAYNNLSIFKLRAIVLIKQSLAQE